MATNIIVSLTNFVFAAMLQSSADFNDDNWVDVRQSFGTCPTTHTFTVPINKALPQMFYRAVPLDNGIVPTPGQPYAFLNGTSVTLGCGLIYKCNDDPMSYYRWYRNGVVIGDTRPHSSEFVDTPPPGIYLYQVQAIDLDEDSWLSQGTLVYVL